MERLENFLFTLLIKHNSHRKIEESTQGLTLLGCLEFLTWHDL